MCYPTTIEVLPPHRKISSKDTERPHQSTCLPTNAYGTIFSGRVDNPLSDMFHETGFFYESPASRGSSRVGTARL